MLEHLYMKDTEERAQLYRALVKLTVEGMMITLSGRTIGKDLDILKKRRMRLTVIEYSVRKKPDQFEVLQGVRLSYLVYCYSL